MSSQRFSLQRFRLADLVERFTAFDRSVAGPALTLVLKTGPHGNAEDLHSCARTIADRDWVQVLLEGRWVFFPFCVTLGDPFPCIDGVARRFSTASDDEAVRADDDDWAAMDSELRCAGLRDSLGYIVGIEGTDVVVRRAVAVWVGGRGVLISEGKEGDFLRSEMEEFVAGHSGWNSGATSTGALWMPST